MSMHLRNSHDMINTEEAGWWTSKTSLEQKLIILSSLLFVLSFCLVISVIVINNKKADGGKGTDMPVNATTPVPEEPTTVKNETETTVKPPEKEIFFMPDETELPNKNKDKPIPIEYDD